MSYTAGVVVGPMSNAISSVWGPGCCISPLFQTGSSAAWPTANLAIFVPVRVQRSVVVVKLAMPNGATASGNFDVGIYDAAGTRLVSTGSTAQSGTSTEQVVDVADTTLVPGLYYLAANMDGTTGTCRRMNLAAPIPLSQGVLTEAVGAVTLPATATFAANQTLNFVPAIYALLDATVA